MPYLWKAVQKKRKYFIDRLVRAGIFKETDTLIQQLTLSELERVYVNFQLSQKI